MSDTITNADVEAAYRAELDAATERNGNLCVELAAVKLERDALRRGMAEMHSGLEVVYQKYKHLDYLRHKAKIDPWHECVRDFLVAVAKALGYE